MKKVYATSSSITASDRGSLTKFINQIENKIDELEGNVTMSENLDDEYIEGIEEVDDVTDLEDDGIFGGAVDYAYCIEDTYGAPQAGVDCQKFETYNDLELYLEAHPDVADRIHEGYATIKEL